MKKEEFQIKKELTAEQKKNITREAHILYLKKRELEIRLVKEPNNLEILPELAKARTEERNHRDKSEHDFLYELSRTPDRFEIIKIANEEADYFKIAKEVLKYDIKEIIPNRFYNPESLEDNIYMSKIVDFLFLGIKDDSIAFIRGKEFGISVGDREEFIINFLYLLPFDLQEKIVDFVLRQNCMCPFYCVEKFLGDERAPNCISAGFYKNLSPVLQEKLFLKVKTRYENGYRGMSLETIISKLR